MFLDLKASTPAAERLGTRRFFELLRDVYRDITTPILRSGGEIYQYVGDEVVVTWLPVTALEGSNCVRCFFMVEEAILSRARAYGAR